MLNKRLRLFVSTALVGVLATNSALAASVHRTDSWGGAWGDDSPSESASPAPARGSDAYDPVSGYDSSSVGYASTSSSSAYDSSPSVVDVDSGDAVDDTTADVDDSADDDDSSSSPAPPAATADAGGANTLNVIAAGSTSPDGITANPNIISPASTLNVVNTILSPDGFERS